MLGLLFAQLVAAPVDLSLKVDGVERTAIVVAPSSQAQAAPLVLAFHGHGGTAKSALAKFSFSKSWPEAISVYPQGLPTKAPNDPEGTRNGWNMDRLEDNKDLKFVDALIASLERQYKIDKGRIFVMGHSNGGGFTYTLWAMRPDRFAAFGPSAAAGARNIKPKPAFVVMGESDKTVDPDRQRRSIDLIKAINGITEPGKSVGQYVTLYAGRLPMGTFIHPGGHEFPDQCIAPMTDFFKKVGSQ